MDTLNSNDCNTAIDANTLCNDCGICCDGTLFSYVSLRDGEREKLADTKFDLYERTNGKFAFKQSCVYFTDGTCGAYSSRPRACQIFFCTIARKVMNGSVSLRDGQKIVAETKAHVAWLRGQLNIRSRSAKGDINFHDFVRAYFEKARTLVGGEEVPRVQKEYIRELFEFAKRIDRSFKETDFLTDFGNLVQRISSKDDPS